MKKIISALAALFCLAALLCGCSGGGTESSTAAESTSIPVPEPESSAPESIEPKPESSEPEPAVLVGEIIPAVAETTVSHGSEPHSPHRFCRKTRRIKHFCGKATTNPSLPWTKAVS